MACRECYATYAESVRGRGEWLLAQSRQERPGSRAPVRRMRPFPRRRIAVWGIAAAVLALVAWGVVRQIDPGKVETWSADAAPVMDLVARSSASGLLFPETTPYSGPAGDFRGPAPGSDAATVDRALGRLLHRYETGEGSADAAYWLVAGVLARGRLDDARVLLAETSARHPDDSRFEVLGAILAFRGNNLNRARSILESVVSRDPKNAVAWTNLGAARAALGLPGQAREAWDRARAAAPGSPAARRAEAYLASP